MQGCSGRFCPGSTRFAEGILLPHLFLYLALATPGLVLALSGRIRFFWLPVAVAFFPTGVFHIEALSLPDVGVFSGPGPLHGSVQGYLVAKYSYWSAHPLFAEMAVALLVLAPATVVAIRRRGERRVRTSLSGGVILALVICPALGIFVAWAIARSISGSPLTNDLLAFGSPMPWVVATFSALLGTRRPWWPWVHLIVPVFLVASTLLALLASAFVGGELFYDRFAILMLVGISVATALWPVLATRIDRFEDGPPRLVVASLFLGAAACWLGIRSPSIAQSSWQTLSIAHLAGALVPIFVLPVVTAGVSWKLSARARRVGGHHSIVLLSQALAVIGVLVSLTVVTSNIQFWIAYPN